VCCVFCASHGPELNWLQPRARRPAGRSPPRRADRSPTPTDARSSRPRPKRASVSTAYSATSSRKSKVTGLSPFSLCCAACCVSCRVVWCAAWSLPIARVYRFFFCIGERGSLIDTFFLRAMYRQAKGGSVRRHFCAKQEEGQGRLRHPTVRPSHETHCPVPLSTTIRSDGLPCAAVCVVFAFVCA